MSSLFNMPWTQVFDSSGNTLNGAKLYFYEAGTSTLKNVYADTDLSVALPNPVIADGGGRFAPIYLGDGLYKVALYTADDVLIWTADNVENQSIQGDIEIALSAISQTNESAGYSGDEVLNPDNFPKAVYKYANAANYYTDSSTVDNVYVLQSSDNYSRPDDYFAGMQVNFVTTRANTSSNISVNVEGLGAKSVFRFDGSGVNNGEFFGMIRLIYNGSFFVFQNAAAGEIGDIKSSVLSANHNEWYLCNGQELARLDFPELFALIGTNFGAGDSATTFNLPDYRGKFLRGFGGNSAADIYTTQGEGLPNITGSIASSTYLGIFNSTNSGAFNPVSGWNWNNGNEGAERSTCATGVNFSAANSNSIYGASDHVTPINQAINYFIKVR